MQLNPTDRRIISLFAQNPKISQEDIAHETKISQPSVAARIKKLKDQGALETHIGINPLKMGLSIGKVDITTTDTSALLEMFCGCPYFVNGFTVSGRFNLCLLFMSENIATMEAIINGHIRPNPNVKEVEFNIVINSEKALVVPAVLTPEVSSAPPCGVLLQCRDCNAFKDKKCMGCPATGQYQGWLF